MDFALVFDMEKQFSVQELGRKIYFIRGHRVMFDSDLAELYEVLTRNLNKAVQRNIERFPSDFMFQLTQEEYRILRFQIGTLNAPNLKFQIGTSSLTGHGGRRKLPFVFTEQGVAMLSSVLRSARAAQVNVTIMRTFVKMRELLETNQELAKKIDALEQKYDSQFKTVFDAIRQLMSVGSPLTQKKMGLKD